MPSRAPRPLGPLVIGALCALSTITGCRTYQPEPLNAPKHRAAWHARSAADEQVAAFADRLAEEGDAAAASFDISDGLTLPEAELVALVYNPDLRLARVEAGVSEAASQYAGRWDDPELEAELLRVTENVAEPWVIGAGLSFSLPISGRLSVEKDRANAGHREALQAVAEAEWRTRHELRQAWLEWSAAVRRAEELRRLIGTIETLGQSMQKLAEAGEVLRTEAALFSIEQAQRRASLLRVQGEAAQQEAQLRTLMGLSPSAPLDLTATLALSPDLDEPDLASLAERNPTLIRLGLAYDVAEQTLRREFRKQVPDLTIGPSVVSEDGQSKIGLVGGIPLPILNLNRRAIAEAEAQRQRARAAFETEYEKLVGRFNQTLARAQALDQERALVLSRTVPLIDRQLDDLRRLIEIGEGDILVLLESLNRANDIKLDLIDLQRDTAKARASLRYLAGPASDTKDQADADQAPDDPAIEDSP